MNTALLVHGLPFLVGVGLLIWFLLSFRAVGEGKDSEAVEVFE